MRTKIDFMTALLDPTALKRPRPAATFEPVSFEEAGAIVCSLFENKAFVELCVARLADFIDNDRFMSQFASMASAEQDYIKEMEAEERRNDAG